mmetsp:Transcript_25798/g.39635  ORF Transcript_25798/g.39635 Transcript_25798/m.39635 type:complete len:656 (+) Transcript_25798:83-2050(+)
MYKDLYVVCLNSFNAVFDLSVKLLETLNVLVRGFPVSSAVGFQEGCDHVTEGVGVGIQKSLLHFFILNENTVSIFENKVINLSGGSGPSHGVTETLLDLTDSLVTSSKHTFVKLGVQKLGTGIKTDGFGKSTNLGVGSGGISHEGHGFLLVVTKTLDNLGWVRIVVMGNISDRNFGRIQVLEGNINILQGRFEKIGLLFHHTGLIGVEGKSLTSQKLILQLTFIFPATVFDSKTDVGTVRSGRVGKDTGSGFTDRNIKFFGLFNSMLTDKVLINGFVSFGGHFDTTIHQVHLVDEKITEDSRAGHNNINTGATKFFQGDKFNLVDTSKGISNGADTDKGQNLGKRFSVSLDVISTPKSESDRFRVGTIIFVRELLKKLSDNTFGNFNSGSSGDGRGVKGVHVTASRKDIGVTDGISTGGGHQEFSVKEFHNTSELVVSNDLLEAEFQVGEDRSQTFFIDIGETSINDSLGPRFLLSGKSSEEGAHFIKHVLDFLDTSIRVGRLLHKGRDSSTRSFNNLCVQFNILEDTHVVSTVNLVDFTANRGGNDTGQALNFVLGTVKLGNVDKSGNGFLCSRGDTNGVKTTWEETRFDLHNLCVNLSDNIITTFSIIVGSVVSIKIGKIINILIKITGPCGGDNGVDNGRSTSFILPQSLVR